MMLTASRSTLRLASPARRQALTRLQNVANHIVPRTSTNTLHHTLRPSSVLVFRSPGRQNQLCTSASADSVEPQIKEYQAPATGFKLFRIAGDGSCMFRAIVQGVNFAQKGVPMSQQSETIAALNLRKAVVQEHRKRKEEMEPFIAGITDNWEEYVTRMEDPAVWGGEPEMVMAVYVIRRPITVYHMVGRVVEPIVTYGEDLLSTAIAVNVLWSGAHYDLLLPGNQVPNVKEA